ncbi:adenylosuccinate lyase family protein [Epibacterium ulvae]|uniref:lyase family protein n=1 Tax=Epibacterium ulvae TaxID=1156985 RepID=UPI001BFBFB4A|nr:lyase family protein [Epibacterium ulvae]MBT8153986.1 adenylosuccinate lyase family protein [Epibacterium ulvae]
MAASLFESQLYSGVFAAGDAARLFSDSAEVRAMLLVEGALAKAQGALGVIPADSAAAIQRAVMEVAIDPGALRAETAQNGVPVPALVAAFRDEMNAPEHAQYVHWGATSQDIMDTALMLRLRQVLALIEADVKTTVVQLAALADTHADRPIAGRSFGLHAAPTSFGAIVASWGAPLLDALEELPQLRSSNLLVSLSGAIGTGGALGGQAHETRAALAAGLALSDPKRSWHTDRGPILRLVGWMHRVTLALAKLGQDCQAMVQTGIETVKIAQGGSSSTLPHKQNPVTAAKLVALAHHSTGLHASLQISAPHQYQRDASAWFAEWLSLPSLVLTAATAAQSAAALSKAIAPRIDQINIDLSRNFYVIHSEALTFALTARFTRPEAQAIVKRLCAEAMTQGVSLSQVAMEQFPDLTLDQVFDPIRQMGTAPIEARAFSKRAQAYSKPD